MRLRGSGRGAGASLCRDAGADSSRTILAVLSPVQVPPRSRLSPQSTQLRLRTQPAGTSSDTGTFVIRKDVDEVLLHATVVDDKQRIVTDLDRTAFAVFEDGKPQTIISFHHEDIPVAMGIVIDNSGSMREKRAKVNQAALNLVRSSNPQDEVFVVNFNDEYYLDQDFTNDLLKLKEALEKIDAKGGTALYEAVVASADHLKRDARLERKVLFVVTDGEDNASRESFGAGGEATAGGERSVGVCDRNSGGRGASQARQARAGDHCATNRRAGVFSQDAGRSG